MYSGKSNIPRYNVLAASLDDMSNVTDMMTGFNNIRKLGCFKVKLWLAS